MADIRAVTVLTFEAAEQEIMTHILDLMQWRNEHNAWPILAGVDTTIELESEVRSGRINGTARLRSEPFADKATLIAEIGDKTPLLTVLGPPQDGYYPIRAWVYVPRLVLNE